jgi:hypothetical protein
MSANQGPAAMIKRAPRNKVQTEFAVFPIPALVEGAYTNVVVAIQTQAVIANSVAMVVVLPVPSARPVRIRAIVLADRLVTTVQRALTSLLVVKISATTAHLANTRILKVLLHVRHVRPAQPLREARRLVTLQLPATRAHTAVQVVAATALLERTPMAQFGNALRVHLVPTAAAVSRTATRARLVNISRTVDTLIAWIARQAKLPPLALQVVTHSVMPACMLPLVVATTALQACTIPP